MSSEKNSAQKYAQNENYDDTKDLNQFVQDLLKKMQDRFEEMSGNITSRIDDMGFFKIFKYVYLNFFIKRR